MLTIDVRIRHENYLVVTRLFDIEIITDAGTKSSDKRLDFSIGQGSIQASTLHVQDLASQGQNCLGFGVAAAHSGAACRVTFHQVNL